MKIFIPLAILGLFGLCFASIFEEQISDGEIFAKFQNFIVEHNKKYDSIEEFEKKFEIFKNNYRKIQIHKKLLKNEQVEATYELAITQFFDLTPQEFEKTYLNLNIRDLQKIKSNASVISPHFTKGNAPENWSWVDQGKVTKVKHQLGCGSCWAFSAMGNIESMYAIKTGKIVEFSEQQLVDCDKVDLGCNGGYMHQAFENLPDGVMTEQDYQYTGKDGVCKFDKTKAVAKLTGYHYVGSEDETVIKQILYEHGPFSVAINASLLQFYGWGILNPWFKWMCNPKNLSHGVLLVGYGVHKTTPYWIIKNSWGSGWGEKGYFRIIAGKGACGINTYVITAEVDQI